MSRGLIYIFMMFLGEVNEESMYDDGWYWLLSSCFNVFSGVLLIFLVGLLLIQGRGL